MGTVLALDYGDARIGCAITDPDRQHALAQGVVSAQPAEKALQEIVRITEAEHVDRIVLGLPLRLDGTEGEQATKTRAFAADLERATNLPVEFLDERFTSGDAEKAAALKGSRDADAEAARLILASWLDRQKKRL